MHLISCPCYFAMYCCLSCFSEILFLLDMISILFFLLFFISWCNPSVHQLAALSLLENRWLGSQAVVEAVKKEASCLNLKTIGRILTPEIHKSLGELGKPWHEKDGLAKKLHLNLDEKVAELQPDRNMNF